MVLLRTSLEHEFAIVNLFFGYFCIICTYISSSGYVQRTPSTQCISCPLFNIT